MTAHPQALESRPGDPPAPATCEATVVLPAWPGDGVGTDLAHLAGLGSSAGARWELIVVEVEPGAASAHLETEDGPLVLTTSEPLDPVIAVNVAAEHAQSPVVVLLAPGARPGPGWLEALLEPLRSREALVAGAGDGRTSGLVVYSDGSSAGGHQRATASPVSVDAVDSGCVAVLAAAWRAHHGLDPRFSLEGMAMADLCFRIRATGGETVVAAGPPVTRPAPPATTAAERQVFRRRWAEVLGGHEPPPTGRDQALFDPDRRRRPVGMDQAAPRRARAGSATVAVHLPAGAAGPTAERLAILRRLLPDAGLRLADPDDGEPSVSWFVSEEALAAGAVAARERFPGALVVADAVSLVSEARRRLGGLGGRVDAEALQREEERERFWYGLADIVFASTAADATALRALLPRRRVEVLAGGPPPGEPTDPSGRDGIVWWADFGLDHNVDAAHWFCREVLPRIQGIRPRATVLLAGPHADRIRTLTRGGVTVGDDEAGRAALTTARVAVCPLRHGSGPAARTTSAAAAGVAVAATSLGADAAALEGSSVAVADDAALLARAVIVLHHDDDVWRQRSRAAQDQLRADATRAVERLGLLTDG